MIFTLIRFYACRETQQKLFRKITILKTYNPNKKLKHLPTNITHLFKPPIKQNKWWAFLKNSPFSHNHIDQMSLHCPIKVTF